MPGLPILYRLEGLMLRDYINLIKMNKKVTAIHFSFCEYHSNQIAAKKKTHTDHSKILNGTSAVHGADCTVTTAVGSAPWTAHAAYTL